MSHEPTVFVVDDEAAMRDSLKWLIESVGLSVRIYPSPEEFLLDYRDQPGCLVLDVRMPRMSGPELHKRLLDRGVVLPVIFITAHGDVAMAVRAMKAGVFDFIEKPFNDQILLDRVQQALTQDAEARRRRTQKACTLVHLDSLTLREQEVMDRVVAGNSNKEIASDLGLSCKTVEHHRSNVMQKMQAGSLADLVQMILLVRNP